MEIPQEELDACLDVLQRVIDARGTISRSTRFNSLISKLYREGKRLDQRDERDRKTSQDRALIHNTKIVQIQRDAEPVAALPPPGPTVVQELNQPEACYICKEPYTRLHFFYHLLCPKCAEYNYRMRDLHADLKGRTALVTGGRVKIGFQTVLRLLRDGANVILTTRFPHSAARRFDMEADSADWRDRLRLYGLDLRNIPAVESFSQYLLDTESAIDIIIHNAAQTIRRPNGFYNELVQLEQNPESMLTPEARRLVVTGAPSTLAISDSCPEGYLADKPVRLVNEALFGTESLVPANGTAEVQPRDLLPVDALEDNEERADSRDMNSWLLTLDQVNAPEMLEVQLVNSVAPFLLNSRLKSLLLRSPFARRFIVNVSAMEGQFSRHKTIYHPHTNMAKAALNMMTRTSGEDYARDRIYMNSVDTGWVTDENPTPKRLRNQDELGFYAPLDIIDGMARIYHPIAIGINSEDEPPYGQFLKDFASCKW